MLFRTSPVRRFLRARTLRVFIVALFTCALAGATVSDTILRTVATRSNAHSKGQVVGLDPSELFRGGIPAGLVLFAIPDPTGYADRVSRMAVLRHNRLQILRPSGKNLEIEFTLDAPPESNDWDELVTLPSGIEFPGLVVYGGSEFARESATVVCYVHGRYQAVFQGGVVDFADFDFDGYPEILDEEFTSQDAERPESIRVWAWDGRKYVISIRVAAKDVWSKQVVEAVRSIAAKRKG